MFEFSFGSNISHASNLKGIALAHTSLDSMPLTCLYCFSSYLRAKNSSKEGSISLASPKIFSIKSLSKKFLG